MPEHNNYVSLAAAAAGGAAAVLIARRFLSRENHRRVLCSSSVGSDLLLSADDISNTCIYLDHNGTTPIYAPVLEEMLPYLTTHFGNPSSGHAYGKEPKAAVSLVRRRVMSLLANDGDSLATADDCIIFTGCGTESDNLAIELALASCGERNHVVTCNIEHPAILECLKVMKNAGKIELSIVAVNDEGIVSADDIAKAIRPDQTALVTIMLANNEVGSLQPIADIAGVCREAKVLLHTDAAYPCLWTILATPI